MKLLTSTGLLYSAVQSQTVDGHYATYPEVDWTSYIAEALQTTAIPGTLGLNPHVRTLETCYDGGKMLAGYGWFTGTVTTGWMLKMYGDTACGNASAVNVATGYVTFTTGTATTTATCITTTAWIWSALTNPETANDVARSTMVVDAVEEWKNGTSIVTTATPGIDPWMVALGGVNAQASHGLGIWNMMMWSTNKSGVKCTQALCGGTYVDVIVNNTGTGWGIGPYNLAVANDVINQTQLNYQGGLNTNIMNSCGTSLSQWTERQAGQYGLMGRVVIGVYTGSNTSCVDYVTDEMSISGLYSILAFQTDVLTIKLIWDSNAATTGVPSQTNSKPISQVFGTVNGTTPTATETNSYTSLAKPLDTVFGTNIYGWNFGVIKQVTDVNGKNYNTDDQTVACLALFSAPEQYGKSAMVSHYVATHATTITAIKRGTVNESAAFSFTVANHGQINHIWPFSKANSGDTVGLWNTTDTHVAFTGMRLGKGVLSMAIFAQTTTSRTSELAGDTSAEATTTAWMAGTATGVSYTGANAYTREIKSPAGGVHQFKGLTQATTNDKYVEVNCRKIHPYFGATAWQDIDNTTAGTTGTSGFILSCMTGISQCITDHSGTVSARTAANSLLTTTEHATCLNDPRYLTWRQMTIVLEWDGTVVWWRTDSFWNPTDYMIASSWGPGTVMSSHISSGKDNTTTTAADQSKSYVFALGDGSGIQLSHITGGSAVVTAPTANTAAGSGSNTLTTSPTSFNNDAPSRADQNYCSSTNLNLTGLADTSALASTVTAYSDGYQATITMTLDWLQAGAQGGWRGVCIVYYTSQYIQDDTNGAVCMTAVQGTGTSLGSDLGGVYLIHVPATTWQPPAATGSVTPSSLALTDAKYGITNTPSTTTAYTYTGGYYASSAWYQPKYASSYADIARFGKDRYTGAYCMQGSGASSYFSAPAAGKQLQSAVTLAAGAIALGSAILAM